jgi:tripartite-type tricarboxylate transporter receptor subunit TctC
MSRKGLLRRLGLAVLGLFGGVMAAPAESVADFYKAHPIELVVGYGAGGGYDAYARLLAPFIGKYVPGSPTVVVENMPGAASLRAANYIYSTAPRDGTVIGTFARDMPLLGILGGNPNVQFDPRRFTWLGSPSSYARDAYVMWARDKSPFKTIEDARRPGAPTMIFGSTGEGGTGNDIALLLRRVLGLHMKIISGYPDSNSLSIAMDDNEIDAHFEGLSATQATHPQWLKPHNGVHPLLQFARATRHPLLPNVPTARELAPDARGRALIELAELPYTLSRPFVAPPDIPPDRAKALQTAFMEAQTDPGYLAVAAKLKVDVSPIGGQQVEKILNELAGEPPDLLNDLRSLQAGGEAAGP